MLRCRWVSWWSAGVLCVLTATALPASVGEAQPRTATAVRAAGAITVDGRLDEPAWQQAPTHTGFAMPLGMAERREIPPETQTSFRVLFDDDHLYFGVVCREPEPARIVTQAARKHDAAMWSDDDVEIFLDPVGDRKSYYQFAVNAQGTQYDSYPTEDGLTSISTWSTAWQAATAVGEAAWTVEVAIPFAGLNRTPAASWGERWAFNLARTRAVAPGYASQFTPTRNGYHDPQRFGWLVGVRVEKGRYNLDATEARYNLSGRVDDGWTVRAEVTLLNRGKLPVAGDLELGLPGQEGRWQGRPFALPGWGRQTLALGITVPTEGTWPLVLRAVDREGRLLFVRRYTERLSYRLLTARLTAPNYRQCIYADAPAVTELRGIISMAQPQPPDHWLTVGLTAGDREIAATRLAASSESAMFALPIPRLAEGRYEVRVALWRPLPGQAEPKLPAEKLGETTLPLRVLPPAPSVEVRVDERGRLLIDGQPVFIRGWYGSAGYLVSAASPVASRLTRGTNFMLSMPPDRQADMGIYSLEAVDRLIDENKAKLDQPIDQELKAKLKEAVAAVRRRHNVIGYYLSDEPECRGLSPVYLESAYRFLAEEDPYRVVMIVSRSPREYMAACDVICPHPYLNPQQPATGGRTLANPPETLRRVIREAVAANDGSKAVWCMPQVFRYQGPYDRHPDFREARWSVFSGVANGATGIVPFIFTAYWNHLPNRLAMDHVFDELTWLAPFWLAGTQVEATTRAPVDVMAMAQAGGHLVVVAANQDQTARQATIRLPALAAAGARRLVVVSENRVVSVAADGSFTDKFAGLAVHLYTTLEVLPAWRTLDQVEREIADAGRRARASGNLLADPAVKWRWVDAGWNFSDESDLADGVVNTAAWLPAYGDQSRCEIAFARPVRFSRVVVHTPSIRSARLEVWQQGRWRVLHTWTDRILPCLEYQGQPVSTTRLRIVPTAMRQGATGPGLPEITELAIY